MITPKLLKFKNIGRFVEEQTINFDELGNLVQVDAENKNTGGSSGSGKSTIFNALDYLFGLNDLPATVLQSRLTKEGILVEGLFDWDGKIVELIRGKGKLSMSVDGLTIEGSAKIVEEKINEMLGMSRDLFRPILHKRQKEGGFFLSMAPADTHEFLTNVLNLGTYAKKIETIEKKVKSLTEEKEKSEIDIKSSRAALTATQDAILALGLAPVRDMHPQVVLDLKTKADASNAILVGITADHKAQNDLLDLKRPKHEAPPTIPQPQLVNDIYDRKVLFNAQEQKEIASKMISELAQVEINRQKSANTAMQEKKISHSTLSYKVILANTAKTEAAKLAEEIKKIRACQCPTCEQAWANEASKAKEVEMLNKLSGYRAQITEGAQAEQSLLQLNMEIVELQIDLTPIENPQINDLKILIEQHNKTIAEETTKEQEHMLQMAYKNKTVLDQYDSEQKAIMTAYNANREALEKNFTVEQQALRHTQALEIDQVRGQADVDRRAFDAATNKLKAFADADARYKTSHESLKIQEEQYNQKISKAEQILAQTDGKITIAEEAKRAIKSFMSCSFDDALDEIGDAATRITRATPNMANSTIQFQGLRETQNGKIKEEVNAVISMDGEEGIDIRSLSGGERSSADLAIDLAVIDLIETRSNKGIGIFILDEPFTGLDTVSIEMVLEILKSAKMNKKILIVDHNETVKQMVDQRIVAVRDGLTSTINQ